ncbi:MAG: polysaccharide biosynthesis tyrosine autokinase [Muribaculaceae bacterium]|nr:polysaccharide biosynthesis tyrosine autokinase [Muribaculaceae bacterium]MDE6753112.1 polysaccharide biosynthesis tyrosine autokinase [Muribaculaceae bacterium]
MNTSDKNSTEITERDDFSIQEFFQLCLSKWKWFLLSFIFFVGVGILYILRQQPVYEREEQILIKDQDNEGGMGSLPSSFSAMGLLSGNTNVNNELIAITSPAVMYEVVDRLGLDVDYTWKKLPHGITLYGTTLPFEFDFKNIGIDENASVRVTLKKDGSIELSKFEKITFEGKEKFEKEVSVNKGTQIVNTPLGQIQIKRHSDFDFEKIFNDNDEVTISVYKTARQDAVEHYSEKLIGDLTDEDADVIDLSIKDVNVERAVDILNTILLVYNENWVADKNKVAVATSRFINERLQVIQQELGDVDQAIAKYQASTRTISLDESAKLSMRKESDYEQQIVKDANKLSIAEYMRDYIHDARGKFVLLPVNMGAGSPEVETQIAEYNDLLLKRNSLIANSSEQNPLVDDYNTRLQALHSAILKGIDTNIRSLKEQLSSSRFERAKEEGRMENTPAKVLPLLSEKRQQAVKEALYLFLLEKREENELSQKFTADNLRVLTPPMGSLRPVAPKKKLIILIAAILGLGIPGALLYFSEVLNTKIRGKKDLEAVKMPFAGEIPHVGKKRKLKLDAKGRIIGRKEEKAPLAVVEEGKRDVVNEAFRVIRSNIDFMSGKDNRCKVILITSFNPGSGKSFISYNLALSFAIKGKRVLLIDCDLRHGSSSMYVGMPKTGLSDYLTEHVDNWKSLVKTVPSRPDLSIMPIGKMPPNPAELLENGLLDQLVDEAKKDYDYIILDCPPVNIVVDTNIVGQLADRTLFVVRAGLLDRSALKELNELYEDKKFKNMSLILNGTEAIHSRYYTYGNYQHLSD